MNQFYNNQYNKEALEFLNEVAQTTLNNSIALLEQSLEIAKESANRNLSRALTLQQINSAEEALNYQREIGQAEFAEMKKAGETYYQIFDHANREFVEVAKKGRGLVEASLTEAAQQASRVMPNGKGAAFAEAMQNSVKVANELMQNSLDVAMQVGRASADNLAKSQQAVAEQVQAGDSKRKGARK